MSKEITKLKNPLNEKIQEIKELKQKIKEDEQVIEQNAESRRQLLTDLSSSKALLCAIINKVPGGYIKLTEAQLKADYSKRKIVLTKAENQPLVTVRLK